MINTSIMFVLFSILILLSIYLYIVFRYVKKVYSRKESIKFIKKDIDMYVDLMSEYDLNARNSKNKKDYINKSLSAFKNISIYQKYIIGISCIRADNFFKQLTNCPYLPDDHNIDSIEWYIMPFEGDQYEWNTPHTRKNIIFLPINRIENTDQFVSLLIHEKVHIYQRYNRDKIDNILRYLGYNKYTTRNHYPYIRSNPDINNFIYTNREGIPMYYEYRSNDPKNIEDVIKNTDYEHPYEYLAYRIEDEFSAYKDNYINIR